MKIKHPIVGFLLLFFLITNTVQAQSNIDTVAVSTVDSVQALVQPPVIALQDVSISAKKPVYINDGEKSIYYVSQDPSVQTGSASDALQNAPGVEVDIEGNITLRGVSSVEIWINGKPSRLEAENLKTYIQQLPANSLERIEVITNPSARYAASGTGGIINIVTQSNIKKNSFLSFGLNGSSKPNANSWLSYMYSNDKFSFNVYLYGNYNFSKGKTNGYNIIRNENLDTSSYRNYTSTWKDNSIWTGVYLYGSYNFDSLKTISFWGGCWGMPWTFYSSSINYSYREYINNPGIYDYFEEKKSNKPYRIGGHFGIEYEHNFNDDGHKLSIELYSNLSKQNQNVSLLRQYINYPDLNKDKKNTQKGFNYYVGSEINYSLPYHKNGLIEMGAEGHHANESVIRRADTLSTNLYVLDSMRYENYVGIWSSLDAYVTVQHKFGGFTMKGGLRTEAIFLKREYINQPNCNGKNNIANVFPSLHLSYSTKSMHNFTLNYTRRVNYQRNSQLTTFITFNEDNFSTGNPLLKPTYTNSVEAGWTKFFNKFGNVGLTAYFKNNKDEMNTLTDVIYSEFFGRLVSFTMPVNSGKSHRYGGDVNVTYKLKTFMNIRFTANLYQSHSEIVFRGNEKVKTDFFGYSFRLNFWTKVWKFLEINASGNYRSKTKTPLFEEKPTYSLNCGLRADFWQKKISVFLNVQDIFNWGKQSNNNTNPYYIAYSSTKWNSRFLSTGITFRFGKIEMESKARTGATTE